MEGVINKAGDYQKLADILLEHPVIKFIADQAKGMDAVRA